MSEDSRQGVNTKGITRDYIWLGNKPLAQLQTKYNKKGRVKKLSLSFIHADHLNTPRIATDQSRNVVWQWDSGAFGEGKVNRDFDGDGNKIKLRVRFPGQYYDGESKLHYNYYRDYDPGIGRYIQSDPIGLKGGINTYVYAGGNPTKNTDPMGLHFYSQERAESWAKSQSKNFADSERAAHAALIYYEGPGFIRGGFVDGEHNKENLWESSNPSTVTANPSSGYAYYVPGSFDAKSPSELGSGLKSGVIAFPKNSVSDSDAQAKAQRMSNTLGIPIFWVNSGGGSGVVTPGCSTLSNQF